jgi:hypothetical protein
MLPRTRAVTAATAAVLVAAGLQQQIEFPRAVGIRGDGEAH